MCYITFFGIYSFLFIRLSDSQIIQKTNQLFILKLMKKIIILALWLFITSINVFAQEKAGKKDTTAHATLYSYACPKHPNFISDKPGKCPKCGMDLTLSAKEQMKRNVTKTYTCPVHADVVSTQSGKCPKCGKNLNLSKKEQMKAEVVKLYTCPMHPDVTSDKAGKCPKCGMDLVEKKTKK
jgi:predicted RNA-binding Zn-ribbon protein involved in translation (DUF1610 family)